MGVAGLLRLLQPYSEQREARDYQGKTLGVDGYSWLHRAAASCADELIRGIASPKLVQSIDNRVRVYEQQGVNLYFVFDGSSLAMKQRVETQRRKAREAARSQSSSSAGSAGSTYAAALRGVDITASHAAMVIAYLKTRGIPFVVAPYEADAQLVWLENNGYIDAIISEDSDLLVFGAKTLLTKCDARTGNCIEVRSTRIPQPLTELECLRSLAIISGCDYSPGVPGMGPVKTKSMIAKFGGQLEAIVDNLVNLDRIEPEFALLARQADLAFQFQRVWDPSKCCLTYLREPDESLIAELTDNIVGTELSRAVAHRMAMGLIDPSDHRKELVVNPSIAQFVQRMRPFRQAKHSTFTTPLGISRAINRKLQIPETSAITPSPEPANSISRFFKPRPKSMIDKENFMLTPQSRGSPTLKRSLGATNTAAKVMRTDTIVDSPLRSRQQHHSTIKVGVSDAATESSPNSSQLRKIRPSVGQLPPRMDMKNSISTHPTSTSTERGDDSGRDKIALIRNFAFHPSR